MNQVHRSLSSSASWPLGYKVVGAFVWASFVLMPLICAGSSSTQSSAKNDRSVGRMDPVEGLVHSADALRIEFRADIQLNAIERGKLSKTKLVGETLHELFDGAPLAKYPYKIRVVESGQVPRERELSDNLAYLNLDTLSIQTRVVRDYLRLDREEALHLLQAIHLDIPPTECKSFLLPQVSDYYLILTEVGISGLSPEQRAHDQYLSWVGEQIRAMTSSTQLAPMATALVELKMSPNEFQTLGDAYALRLGQLRATDREMALIQSDASLVPALQQLASLLQQESWPTAPLLAGYERFLERSASEPRCSDSTEVWKPADWKRITQEFNKMKHDFGWGGPGSADFVSIRRSAESGDSARLELMPDPGHLFDGLDKLLALRSSSQHEGEGASTLGWQSDLAKALNGIDALDPSHSSCYVCVFSEKASLLFLYFDFAPSGEWKENVLGHLMHLLGDRTAEQEFPLDWLHRFRIILNMSRKPSREQAQKIQELVRERKAPNGLPSDLGPQILQQMRDSGSQTMYLYATADELLQNEFVMPPHPD